jgi:M6 family metalloprotease-like protein
MNYLRVLISLFLIFICANNITAQIDSIFQCPTDQRMITQVEQLSGVSWTLKILLVEFQDVHHKTPGYTYNNWNNLFFSTGIYVSPNMYSPDGQQVFGSMKDYYSIMSDGQFTINGYVINQDANGDQVPDWLTLPLTKSYYDNQNWSVFVSAAFTAANNAGLDISTNSTTKLAIIYAGHTYRGAGSGLNPRANGIGGTYYINGELFAVGSPYRSERADAKFSEIGINVHEFGHLVGEYDLYSNGFFDVMNAGCYTGPNQRAACPMPFNPQTRYKKGWISFDPITTNYTYQSDYNLRDPEVFKIQKTNDPNYYWLIETRRFNQTMVVGSTTCNDYNYYLFRNFFANSPNQGVLVWKVVSNGSGTLLRADGKDWLSYPWLSLGTPFPGSGNAKVLSPWSDTRTSPTWVPNTKPSVNVGMEIINQGTGWYLIDLYATNPENASPSKPQNLTVTVSANLHPYLSWTANQEPDLNGYVVDKYVTFPPGWQYLTTRSSSQNYYEDLTETICPPGQQCQTGHWVRYRVKAVDNTQKVSVPSDSVMQMVLGGYPDKISVDSPNSEKPTEYSLMQNYPNPFNPTTTISYSVPKNGLVTLKVYDILGKEVAELVNETKETGNYSVTFNASELPSGIYFYTLTSGNFMATKKLILLK